MRKLLALILVFSLALALGQGLAPAQSAGFVDVLIGFNGLPDAAVVTALGGEVTYTFSIVPAVAATVPEGAVKALQKHPSVAYVEHDGIVTTMAQSVPWGVSKIAAPTVHSWGNKGAGIKVGIIDTGIQTNHPDLKTYGGYNYVSGNTNYNDDNGHGTHVAGTVACLDNTTGYIGVAPAAYLYGVKVLSSSGSGTWTNVAKGIDWCRSNGMKVINMSLGGSSGSTTLSNACKNAYNAGIVVVAAAGNSGNSSGTGDNVGYPARYSSVIAVAATDSSDKRAYFSSTGPAVEIAAPGVSIPSTWIGSGYRSISGTSMASPHVAGTAALVRYKYPSWSASAVRDRMNSTALDLGTSGRDYWYGYGRVRANYAAQ